MYVSMLARFLCVPMESWGARASVGTQFGSNYSFSVEWSSFDGLILQMICTRISSTIAHVNFSLMFMTLSLDDVEWAWGCYCGWCCTNVGFVWEGLKGCGDFCWGHLVLPSLSWIIIEEMIDAWIVCIRLARSLRRKLRCVRDFHLRGVCLAQKISDSNHISGNLDSIVLCCSSDW